LKGKGKTVTKKVLLGTLLFGLIGILVVGAAIRTIDKTGNVAEAQGNGHGAGRGADIAGTTNGASTTGGDCDGEANTNVARGNGQGQANASGDQGGGGQGQASASGGQGGGRGVAAGSAAGTAADAVVPEDWTTVEGTVTEAPAAGVDMVVKTDAGDELVIGTGPGYLEAQGFQLEAGELVRVQGFWEDGEFKAGEITRLRDGNTVMLRDAYGRPLWAGAGQRRAASEGTIGQSGNGQGQGANTQGQGANGQGQGASPQGQAPATQGGFAGEGNTTAPGDGTGTGQAQVDGWVTLEGFAATATADEVTFQADSGEQVLVEGRALRFIQEQGFSIQANDRLRLTGFYENGVFEVGGIENLTSKLSVSIREESGRPLWAGGGRGGQ
jgi:uncharacterized protein YdeI (BOF family)